MVQAGTWNVDGVGKTSRLDRQCMTHNPSVPKTENGCTMQKVRLFTCFQYSSVW